MHLSLSPASGAWRHLQEVAEPEALVKLGTVQDGARWDYMSMHQLETTTIIWTIFQTTPTRLIIDFGSHFFNVGCEEFLCLGISIGWAGERCSLVELE